MQRRRSARSLVATIVATGSWGCGRPAVVPCAPAPAPAASSSPAPAPVTHEQVAEQVLTALGDHDFDAVERLFDDRMQKDVPKEKLGRVWSGAVAAHGELLSWKLVTREDARDYEQLLYELELENGALEALVTFGPRGGKVAGLFIRPVGSR